MEIALVAAACLVGLALVVYASRPRRELRLPRDDVEPYDRPEIEHVRPDEAGRLTIDLSEERQPHVGADEGEGRADRKSPRR